MRRTSIAVLTLAVATLAGCGSDDSSDTKPKKPSKTTTVDAAEQRRACIQGWMDVLEARPDDFDPETDEDLEPAGCAGVPDVVREDLYMDALEQVNEEGQDELSDCLDDPGCTSFPVRP
ncbi:hypothetical protein GPA10_05175 [Streptomyces sp. p1417]|uniref:Uncharacterized protein n=1 Tax=Streptomyces typhae TaxID=2681492 RepID=A0A6L6WRM8_9ACTN|nr:hypothetical protein [Streptomyces typhae]MVO84178.1 hypothetical protein [Streptomyces typhae]